MRYKSLSPWEKMYRKYLLFIFSGVFIYMLILALGWLGIFNTFGDAPEVWFQRSGSLMTMTILFSDYFVFRLVDDVSKLNMMPPEALETKDKYRRIIRFLPLLALLLTSMATIIWGYGDIIYPYTL